MLELIEWLNVNEGATNAIISVVSLIVAFLAVVISISTSKRQNRIDLFEKRYEVFCRFSELIKLAEIVSRDALTPKGKMMTFNCSFFGMNTESSNIGLEISRLDEEISLINSDNPQYKNLFRTKEEKAKRKSVLDYAILIRDELLLEKCKLLFDNSFNNNIKEFFKTYSDVVMSANFIDIENMDNLFSKWNEICIKLKDEKYLEKMKKYINLNK